MTCPLKNWLKSRLFVRHFVKRWKALDADRAYLTEGNVFTDDQIDAFIELKMEEVIALEHAPHPIEFQMYYSY